MNPPPEQPCGLCAHAVLDADGKGRCELGRAFDWRGTCPRWVKWERGKCGLPKAVQA